MVECCKKRKGSPYKFEDQQTSEITLLFSRLVETHARDVRWDGRQIDEETWLMHRTGRFATASKELQNDLAWSKLVELWTGALFDGIITYLASLVCICVCSHV
jgi:hypothetical protein